MAQIIELSSGAALTGPPGTPGSSGALAFSFSGSSGLVGQAYSAAFMAVGGTPSYVYSISVGSIPPGLSFDTSTGILSGTPTTVGSYSFTGKVVDSVSAPAIQ